MNGENKYKQWGGSANMTTCYVPTQQSLPVCSHPTLPGTGHGFPGHTYIAIPNNHVHSNPIVIPQTGGQVASNIYQNDLATAQHYNLTPIGAIPTALPPSLSIGAKLPQFNNLYEEFERKMSNQAVQMPQTVFGSPLERCLSTLSPATNSGRHFLAPSGGYRGEHNSFVSAMKNFMRSYEPTASFESKGEDEDWGKEAQALLDEITSFTQEDMPKSSGWPTLKRKTHSVDPESSTSCHDGDDTFTGDDSSAERSPSNIQQHILKIKPSPYPGGSPGSSKLSSVGSSHSSDEYADDEATSTSNSVNTTNISEFYYNPRGGTIGHRTKSRSFDAESAKGLRYPESGYVSSSTDGGSAVSRRRGSQSPTTAGIDSDDMSSISSRSMSPARARCQRNIREFGAVSPTKVDPYVNSLLAAPWLKTLPSNSSHPRASGASNSSVQTVYKASDRPFVRTTGVEGREVYQKHKKWITEEILEMIAVRDRLYKRMKKHPAPDIVEMYKKVRNMVVGMTRNAKRVHEKKMDDARNGRVRAPTTPREYSGFPHRTSTYTKRK